MSGEFGQYQGPRHAKSTRGGAGIAGKVVATLLALALVAGGGFFAFRALNPDRTLQELISSTITSSSDAAPSSVSSEAEAGNGSADVADASDEKAREAAELERIRAEEEAAAHDGIPTPLIARYEDVLVHSPIHTSELEGIIFHQASFETALVMSTELSAADVEAMEIDPDYEIAEDQPEGDEWLKAKALHLWREDTPTDMDTSIDVGAEAGTTVYAPVTGTVVLVKTYDLYDTCEDFEVHIQPTGRPDLDVVEIHIQDVVVKAGDKVIGGETPIASVRDLAAEDITDIQLAYYTREGHGNHTHVQINDANYPEYRETRLKDAYVVKDEEE